MKRFEKVYKQGTMEVTEIWVEFSAGTAFFPIETFHFNLMFIRYRLNETKSAQQMKLYNLTVFAESDGNRGKSFTPNPGGMGIKSRRISG